MKISDRLRKTAPYLYGADLAHDTVCEAIDALDAAEEAISQLLKCHDAGSEQWAREALAKLRGAQ